MQYCISSQLTILDALTLLNNIGREKVALFVVDSNNHLQGSLTDGDIRRGLIYGQQLNNSVLSICHRDCNCLQIDNLDVSEIKRLRDKGFFCIPVVDENRCLVDVIDLENHINQLPLDAVIMAGGKGERLRPLTDNTPKPLLEMNGKAIIDYIIGHIILYGINNISVTVNYLKEQLQAHFANPFDGIQVNTVSEPQYLGTIGSISYVKEFHNDTVLLMNSDAITDINLEDFYLHFRENGADMSCAAIPYSVSVPYGIFDLDGQNVKGILEKPTYNYYANAGIYLIKRELLSLIPEGKFYNVTDFMELLVEKGYKVIRFPLNGTWIDIGNKQDYQKAQEIVKYIKR